MAMRLPPFESEGRRSGPLPLAVLLAGCLVASCGMIGAPDDHPKGDRALPLSGVGPYTKQFVDCDSDSPDPIFMTPDGDDVVWSEPWLLQEGDSRFMLFFEERVQTASGERLAIRVQRIAIVRAPPDSCRTWDVVFLSPQGDVREDPDPSPVLQGGGAPSVLAGDGVYRIWYGLEDGGGVDHVEMLQEAGGRFVPVRPPEPVLRPTESWERGTVGSPSVLENPMNGKLELWYEGSVARDRSIGYARWDPEARRWVKRDAAGRNSVDNPGEVRPVLWPSQPDWEYHYPTDLLSGSVGTPHVILFRSPARTYYYMYYTGNLTNRPAVNPAAAAELEPLASCIKERAPLGEAEGCLTEEDRRVLAQLSDQDTSIGFAGSLDGINWVKASTIQEWGEIAWQVNPILNEVFAIDALNKIWVAIRGKAYEEKIRGSTNVFFPLVIVDEMAPATVNLRTAFLMVYQQAGGLSFRNGLALATVER